MHGAIDELHIFNRALSQQEILSLMQREDVEKNAGNLTSNHKYRYGYQGQFAEKDDETGWDHFELREYDPVIGRWMVPDPMGMHWSPYLAMSNNPVNIVDPDGGCENGDCNPTPGQLNSAGTHTWGLNASTGQYEWSPVMAEAQGATVDKMTAFRQDLGDLLLSAFTTNRKFGVRFWGDGLLGNEDVFGGSDWHPGMEVIDVNVGDMNQVLALLNHPDVKKGSFNNKTLTGTNLNIKDKVDNVVNAILKTKGAADILSRAIKNHFKEHANSMKARKAADVEMFEDTLPYIPNGGNSAHKYSSDSSYYRVTVYDMKNPTKVLRSDTLRFKY